MFPSRKLGSARATRNGGGEGPVAIPRGEKVQLRSRKAVSPANHEMNPLSPYAPTPNATNGGEKVPKTDPKVNDSEEAPQQLPPHQRFHPGQNHKEKTNGSSRDNNESGKGGSALFGQSTQAGKEPTPLCHGQALEYAAGYSLRKKALEPVLNELDGVGGVGKDELQQLLMSYSKGTNCIMSHQGINKETSVYHCSIERVVQEDDPVLASWWKGDKYLSHTSEEWSNWWTRRSHGFDPGCEMVKLITKAEGRVLGVVYYERNIVDRHLLEEEVPSRITLIRGMRLDPTFNPEVIRRSKLQKVAQSDPNGGDSNWGIESLLLNHVLLASIRYGSNGVAVNCPKSETWERFYRAMFGPPLLFEEETGRRYYRISSESRWNMLQHAFRRQVGLSTQEREHLGEDETSEGTTIKLKETKQPLKKRPLEDSSEHPREEVENGPEKRQKVHDSCNVKKEFEKQGGFEIDVQ